MDRTAFIKWVAPICLCCLMSFDWSPLMLGIILFLVVAVIILVGAIQASQGVGTSPTGCDFYCQIKDVVT